MLFSFILSCFFRYIRLCLGSRDLVRTWSGWPPSNGFFKIRLYARVVSVYISGNNRSKKISKCWIFDVILFHLFWESEGKNNKISGIKASSCFFRIVANYLTGMGNWAWEIEHRNEFVSNGEILVSKGTFHNRRNIFCCVVFFCFLLSNCTVLVVCWIE